RPVHGDGPRGEPAGDAPGSGEAPERARRCRAGDLHAARAREVVSDLPAPAHRRGRVDGGSPRALGRAPRRAQGARRAREASALSDGAVSAAPASSAHALSWSRMGSCRMRFPVAAKIALQIAGGTGGTPGSPTPPKGLAKSPGTMCTR